MLKVKYVEPEGSMKYPCYEDENGNLYFDVNNGMPSQNICLYSGAYRTDEGRILGKPEYFIAEEDDIECENPFKRSVNEFYLALLYRMHNDCDEYCSSQKRDELSEWFESICLPILRRRR